MADTGRTFSITREIARKELYRHQSRFLGVTTTAPRYIDQGDTDTDAFMQWVVDVRMDIRQFGGKDFKGFAYKKANVGLREDEYDFGVVDPEWGLLKNVVVSQWAVGAITDLGMPVLMERDEAGQITVIARSAIRLPDITYKTYSYNDLGFVFMTNLIQDTDGNYFDAFGQPATDPSTVTGSTLKYTWDEQKVDWGGTDFVFGATLIDENNPQWIKSN